ncbi:hypothetical protein HWV62_16874 [Athelia sp. TMB]|nr:hypothetical protein HWV62_16874 [Athelia sp. TMB]
MQVAALWILDTFDTALCCHILYHYLVSNFLNPAAMASPVWSILTSFAELKAVITVRAFSLSSWTDLTAISHLFYLNFASGCAGDVYVALALSWYLWHSRTGFARTDGLVRTLMLYAINTGAMTAAGQYIIMPTNFIFVGFYLMLSKLYINSYLATLNAREALFEQGGVVSIHMSQMAPHFRAYGSGSGVDFDSQPSTVLNSTKRSNELEINVETVVDTKSDPFVNYGTPKKM